MRLPKPCRLSLASLPRARAWGGALFASCALWPACSGEEQRAAGDPPLPAANPSSGAAVAPPQSDTTRPAPTPASSVPSASEPSATSGAGGETSTGAPGSSVPSAPSSSATDSVSTDTSTGTASSDSSTPDVETPTGTPEWRDGGFFSGETRFVIQGVAYNPVKKGGTHPDGLDFSGAVTQDAALMRAAGINTVRTYVALTDRAVLDELHAAGVFVINGVYQYGGSPVEEAASAVNAVKDHPAILMWSIGNEWNYNGLYVDMSFEQSLARLNEVASIIRQNDTSHPITCIYGELPNRDVIERMPLVDVWGVNAYRGLSFGANFFDDYRRTTSKPMFLAEYGADAYDARVNAPNVEAQAEAVANLTREILAQTEGGVLGGTVFEWSDEWWKDGSGSPSEQDVGGVAPGGGPHPDQTFNEEWWGIVDIDRNPRPAYEELKKLYAP